jgi:adenylylsulfate kinase
MVIWLIGLSGSGKTTLGKEICSLLKAEHLNTVFLDGDMVRAISGNDLGHTIEDRWQNAQRVSRLCFELERQGIHVVCAILSIFHESQRWNRENLSSYKEIFLDVSMDTLKRRDIRGLYARVFNHEENNVVGVDIEFTPPYAPDLIINNDRDNVDMGVVARHALEDLEIDIGTGYRYSRRNLLESPEKYEYTKYVGSRFLDSYCRSRSRAIELLCEKVRRTEQLYSGDGVSHPWVYPLGLGDKASFFFHRELPPQSPGAKSSNKLTTGRFLHQSMDAALLCDPAIDLPLVFDLVRQFEVSKKVYEVYTLPNLRAAEGNSDDLVNYGLFGTLLATIYPQVGLEQQLILFNALLKINDILESAIGIYCTPVEHYLALVSLKKEQEIFHELRHEHAL